MFEFNINTVIVTPKTTISIKNLNLFLVNTFDERECISAVLTNKYKTGMYDADSDNPMNISKVELK